MVKRKEFCMKRFCGSDHLQVNGKADHAEEKLTHPMPVSWEWRSRLKSQRPPSCLPECSHQHSGVLAKSLAKNLDLGGCLEYRARVLIGSHSWTARSQIALQFLIQSSIALASSSRWTNLRLVVQVGVNWLDRLDCMGMYFIFGARRSFYSPACIRNRRLLRSHSLHFIRDQRRTYNGP
jgi:hypothetical protein